MSTVKCPACECEVLHTKDCPNRDQRFVPPQDAVGQSGSRDVPPAERLGWAWVAIRTECGCMTGILSPEVPPKVIADQVAEWVAGGYLVERRPCEEARERWTSCKHRPIQKTLLPDMDGG